MNESDDIFKRNIFNILIGRCCGLLLYRFYLIWKVWFYSCNNIVVGLDRYYFIVGFYI